MKITEIFYSIQGEGVQIGVPTTFIRTTGCNLRCNWCDTKYAYEEGKETKIEEILSKLKEFPASNICLTGGEPLLQEDTIPLLQRLSEKGYNVCLETNGSKPIEDLPCLDSLMVSLDIKCPSSDMQDKMNFANLELLSPNDQLKFIIAHKNDYEYAKDIIAKYKPVSSIIMIPLGGKELKELADWVLEDGLNVRVLPQLHKLIWGEKRGV
ncbi:MAG: radical SAM protein [Candidatus Aenigmarchaeota archaeon]|nr:radical SAM protein [Candidatus Aenigmarchaeota archaeon]